jgi:peptidoglycan hydrolase-like protein with peptidoglycan-binding domain
VSEEFLKARCYGAGVLFDRSNTITPPKKLSYNFKNVLTYGMVNNADVKALQAILKAEGLFPDVECTGNYFQVTQQGVRKFQEKYKVAIAVELALVDGKRVGSKTLKRLNELYS